MKLVSREISFPQTDPHYPAYESAGYASASGQEIIRLRYEELDNDIFDNYTVGLSSDNGRTWMEHERWPVGRKLPEGTRRAMWSTGIPDPRTGRLVLTGKEGVFRHDNSLEGMTHYCPYYRVSEDAGRTWSVYEPIIQSGEEYTAEHPCRGVHLGRNSVTPANAEIFTADGRLLVPCNVSTVGPDGHYFRPEGAYTYTAGGVLVGTWRDDGRLDWDFSQLVSSTGSLHCSSVTRFVDEPSMEMVPMEGEGHETTIRATETGDAERMPSSIPTLRGDDGTA